ncbi:uncharacterized protein LOC132611107 isoform X2 [Lycium barbarum]|uniref:uncharacterized protein LOC132611107 isoform X2 n=1 Tax=Lycium barbarum TaxID=112863 RepID=UPI00293F1EE8|nr:uncharacterized protein LOC132611107 isoform X2 [Lycium barbarum]
MTYGNCGEPNHNARGYYRDKSTGKGSNSRKGKRPMNGNNSQSTSVRDADENETATQQSVVQAATQEFEPYSPDVGIEEDPALRPIVIYESQLKSEKLKMRSVPSGTRQIKFTGDHTGVSVHTNLPYSPVKTTWNGKETCSSGQLQMVAKNKKKAQNDGS